MVKFLCYSGILGDVLYICVLQLLWYCYLYILLYIYFYYQLYMCMCIYVFLYFLCQYFRIFEIIYRYYINIFIVYRL